MPKSHTAVLECSPVERIPCCLHSGGVSTKSDESLSSMPSATPVVGSERLCVAGIAKKQAERQQKAKEEAIASGMLSVKGSGKHKNRSNVDKGLVEDGGLFKAGMLRIKSTALGKSTSSKRKGPLSQRRAFSSGKIGNLDGNSQKAWNVASAQKATKKGPFKKGRK